MKNKGYLLKATILTLSLWIIAQIITLCFYWDMPQFSDAAGYDRLARQCFEHGTLYPDATQIFANYIFNPGYVNYLLLHLSVFGTLAFVGMFNILLNVLIIWEVFLLARYFFNQQTALIAVILYCILPTNVLLAQPHLTEIPFLAAMLGAICLVRRNKYVSLILAGVLFVVANWIRPIAFVFLLPVLVYMLYHRFHLKNYVFLLLPLLAVVLLIGISTKAYSGYFMFQASTGGYNLIQGANDRANGGYVALYQEGEAGYIEGVEQLTFKERDVIWKNRSLEWIKQHPVKYVTLIPFKLARLWWGDDYLNGFLSGYTPFFNANPTFAQKAQRVLSGILFSLTYYMILLCFVFAIFKRRKNRNIDFFILLTPLVLGSLMQSIIYGTQRYHYPYMPIVIFFAAWWVHTFWVKRTRNSSDLS